MCPSASTTRLSFSLFGMVILLQDVLAFYQRAAWGTSPDAWKGLMASRVPWAKTACRVYVCNSLSPGCICLCTKVIFPRRAELTEQGRMAYVPGFAHDVFISYAHVDNLPLTEGDEGWISKFHASLEVQLRQILGRAEE